MKWKTDQPDKPGLTRTKTFFAFLPYKLGNEVRWLERISIRQESARAKDGFGNRSIDWFDRQFIDGVYRV